MTSHLTPNIRLVKCPRCRRVLPELSNVPVYQCGGCDAVLQVKKRKNGTNDTGLHLYETDITQKNEIEHEYEDMETRKEANGKHSVEKITENLNYFSSGRESFEAATEKAEKDLDTFRLKHRKGAGRDGMGSEDLIPSDELDSSMEFGHNESEQLSPVNAPTFELQENNRENEEPLPVYEAHDEKGNDLENNEIFSPEIGTSSEFDEDAISQYIFGNFKNKKLSAMTPQRLSRESTSTENLSPPHVEPKQDIGIEPINSNEALENKEISANKILSNLTFPSNELSCEELEESSPIIGAQTEAKKSSMSRFVFGSLNKENTGESSLEKSNSASPQSRKSKRSDSVSSEEILENIAFTHADSAHRKNDDDGGEYLRRLKGKSVEAETSQLKELPTNSHSNSFSRDQRPYDGKGFTHGRPVRKWTQFQRDARLSGEVIRENGGPSNSVRNKFHFDRSTNFPPPTEDPENEKLKLKKMVLELQDQFNRSQILNHNGNLNRYYERGDFSRKCNFSGIPFSADAAIRRPQMYRSCLQCSPRDLHCSAPLSPHFYSKPSQYISYLNQDHYNIHCPFSGFPQKMCEMTHDNDYREKKNYRERNHVPRRHVLPVKGGAPFVVCDQCSNLLQLPADFLLFRKKYHQLRCGSCNYILKFLLFNGYRLERFVDNGTSDLAPAPPPSEVDDLRDVNKENKILNAGNFPHVESMCISEDYGPSICKSCSTEGDPLSVVVPYNVQKRDTNREKKISGGFVDRLNRRKKQPHQSVLKESQNIYKDNRISKADKSSPIIERPRGRDVSPLHRLMGYNSAREVSNA